MEGTVRVFVPGGYGTEGTDQESVKVAMSMLKELALRPIVKTYDRVHMSSGEYSTRRTWGCVMSAIVKNHVRTRDLLVDLGFHIVIYNIDANEPKYRTYDTTRL